MRGDLKTTTYEAIQKLIDKHIIRDEKTAKEIIFNAYYSNRTDGIEYFVLVNRFMRKWAK